MVKLKKNSRRQKLSQKFNIEKKVREHRRKMRKMAKQKDGPVRKKHRRDPGIPNSCPFKQDIIRTLQLRKQQNEAARALFFDKQKRHEREAQEKRDEEGIEGPQSDKSLHDGDPSHDPTITSFSSSSSSLSSSSSSLQKLVDTATAEQAKYAATIEKERDGLSSSGGLLDMTAPEEHYLTQERRQQHQLLRRVLQQADVVIEVLDARMPEAFRCPALERWILGEGKKLILVMNKVDLVPKEAAVAWLKTLQQGIAPALAFKCAGGSPGARKRGTKRGGKRKLKNGWTDVEPLQAPDHLRKCSSHALGATALLRLLNCLAHTAAPSQGKSDDVPPLPSDLSHATSSSSSSSSTSPGGSSSLSSSKQKSNLVVGIVGYPNVGKSSLVNALTRSCNAAGVAALPGSTRTLQFVRIDKHIQLIDSPGVFFAPSKNPQDDALLLPPSSSSSLAQQTHSSSPPPSSLSSTQETPQTSTTLSPSQGGSASPSEESSSSFFILRSLLPVHRIENPEEIAGAVVAWSCTETLQRLYQIEAFANPSEFFSALARRRGKLKKGGVPDTLAAAKMFLQDWQSGVIPYYTMPPTNNSNQSSQDSSGEEKKVFWKDTPHEDRQTEKGKEGLPATTRGSDVSMERNETSMKDEKEVYADLLFSQCQAIRRGEGEEKIEGEEEENMEGGQADGLNGAKRKISTEEKSRPQRKFMLLRFAPVPESEVKDKQKVRSSSTGGEKISSDMRKVNSSKSGIPRKEDPTSRKLAAKKEAKKKRKLLNKRRRLLEEKKTGGLDEEEAEEDEDASMDEDKTD